MERSEVFRGLISPLFFAVAVCLFTNFTTPGTSRSDSVRRELEDMDPSFRESALRGWRYFQTSFAEDGIACVHCHRDHTDMVTWAGSYPKVQIFDGTPYKVKTLRTVILEAMDRHTDLEPAEYSGITEDLQAYIAWWGDGQPLTPGITHKGMPPEEDIAELEKTVDRGRLLFHREKPVSCSYCHALQKTEDSYLRPIKDILLKYPKPGSSGERAVSLDRYLLSHYRRQGVFMSPRQITEISAYLADLSRGKVLRPGGKSSQEEEIP